MQQPLSVSCAGLKMHRLRPGRRRELRLQVPPRPSARRNTARIFIVVLSSIWAAAEPRATAAARFRGGSGGS